MEKDLHTGSRNQILNLKQVQLPAMQLLTSALSQTTESRYNTTDSSNVLINFMNVFYTSWLWFKGLKPCFCSGRGAGEGEAAAGAFASGAGNTEGQTGADAAGGPAGERTPEGCCDPGSAYY